MKVKAGRRRRVGVGWEWERWRWGGGEGGGMERDRVRDREIKRKILGKTGKQPRESRNCPPVPRVVSSDQIC